MQEVNLSDTIIRKSLEKLQEKVVPDVVLVSELMVLVLTQKVGYLEGMNN